MSYDLEPHNDPRPPVRVVSTRTETRDGREFKVTVLEPEARQAVIKKTAKEERLAKHKREDRRKRSKRQAMVNPSTGQAAITRATKMMEKSRKRMEGW